MDYKKVLIEGLKLKLNLVKADAKGKSWKAGKNPYWIARAKEKSVSDLIKRIQEIPEDNVNIYFEGLQDGMRMKARAKR